MNRYPYLNLVLNASVVVQVVMGLLILASLTSWVMIFQRGFALSSIRRQATDFESEFWSGKDLGQLYVELDTDKFGCYWSGEYICVGIQGVLQVRSTGGR